MKAGFTLVEILVIIAIISILAAIVIIQFAPALNQADIARAQADLQQIAVAIEFLRIDTKQGPGHIPDGVCEAAGPNNDPRSIDGSGVVGLAATDGTYPKWKGHYMRKIPLDPWGRNYVLDPLYNCNSGGGNAIGCKGQDGNFRVIHSRGPDGSPLNAADADNIVLILCK